MVLNGRYKYYDDLLALDSQCGHSPTPNAIISTEIDTSLRWTTWAAQLANHPDRQFVNYILSGIHDGFRIGFCRSYPLQYSGQNLHILRPSLVSDYLAREVQLHRMWRCPKGFFPRGIHISPIGLIPKKHKPGRWRLIVDLSSPMNFSVNEGISKERSSLSYASVDHLAALIVAAGRGSFLVKADIKEAYRMVPVHPEDQYLLGVQWQGTVFIDRMLPFGLRSTPKIFTAITDAIQWMLRRQGVSRGLHYLDDFIFVAQSQPSAELQKRSLLSLFDSLGVPVEPSKLEGPSPCLTFLGIEVDAEAFQLRLPRAKLTELLVYLRRYAYHRSVTKHALEQLTGLLQFASKVVRPGRPFVRRLYTLQGVGSRPDHLVRLNNSAIADITWWLLFSEQWNGVSLLWDLGLTRVDISIYTDASGSWGCGAVQNRLWLQLKWSPRLYHLNIAVKELIPVVLVAATFGTSWSGKMIQFVVDNEAVVSVLNSTTSKDIHMMHLIRLLVFFAARHDFWFSAIHIPGRLNSQADAISRNRLDQFFAMIPHASPSPASISRPLVELISQNITWISPSWAQLFVTVTSDDKPLQETSKGLQRL